MLTNIRLELKWTTVTIALTQNTATFITAINTAFFNLVHFISAKPFNPSLIFASKDSTFSSGA